MKKVILIISILASLICAKSIEELKKLAKEGNVEAVMKLALMYENGKEVNQNIDIAKRYYLQAKELGSDDAAIALSLLELSKDSGRKTTSSNSVNIKLKSSLNYEISIKDLKEIVKKAKQGDSEALFTLATLYDNGYTNVKADSKKALLLYIKSAKLGNKKAKEVLALKRGNLKESLK